MEIKISKYDVLWNYLAQVVNLGSGLIVLPVVLHLLSAEEIGMNYLMLSVSSLVALFDFGFSDQFSRNITYVFSGARELKKEGMGDLSNGGVNYHLLAVVIETAKYIYRLISIIAIITMLTLGSLYIYRATNGFSTINHSLLIWLIFSFATYFDLYFKYYGSLLMGAALVMESKKASMLNRLVYIIISFILLFLGCGLFSLVIANIISPFVGRWYSYRKFYSPELRSALNNHNPKKEEIKETFFVLWYNAKKLGINFLGAYGIQQSGTFIIGLFLPLKTIASYGLMCQLFQVSSAFAMGLFLTYLPEFYKSRVNNNLTKLRNDFSFSSFVFILLFMFLGLSIILGGDFFLKLIGSSTELPIAVIMILFFVHMLLESFHSMCATMIVTNNQVPFVSAAIVSGLLIILGNLLVLEYTALGLLGVVIVQFVVQMCYNHWKWPMWIFRELDLNIHKLLAIGANQTLYIIRNYSK